MAECKHLQHRCAVTIQGSNGKPENWWRCMECADEIERIVEPPTAYRKNGAWHNMDGTLKERDDR